MINHLQSKKTEEGETDLGEVTKLAEQHAIWGETKKLGEGEEHVGKMAGVRLA